MEHLRMNGGILGKLDTVDVAKVICIVFLFQQIIRMGNCPTLFKRVCCVWYNLPHPPLKVWLLSGVVVCLCVRTPFHLPCVCVCFSKKKKKNSLDVNKYIFIYINGVRS